MLVILLLLLGLKVCTTMPGRYFSFLRFSFVEMRFCYVAQVGLKLLVPASASQATGTIGACHHTWLQARYVVFSFLLWWYWGLNSGPVLARKLFYHLGHASAFFAYTCNPSNWEAEAGGSRVPGQPGLHS
jgi:hypothetical protein